MYIYWRLWLKYANISHKAQLNLNYQKNMEIIKHYNQELSKELTKEQLYRKNTISLIKSYKLKHFYQLCFTSWKIYVIHQQYQKKIA